MVDATTVCSTEHRLIIIKKVGEDVINDQYI
jgi:hypothetical protein